MAKKDLPPLGRKKDQDRGRGDLPGLSLPELGRASESLSLPELGRASEQMMMSRPQQITTAPERLSLPRLGMETPEGRMQLIQEIAGNVVEAQRRKEARDRAVALVTVQPEGINGTESPGIAPIGAHRCYLQLADKNLQAENERRADEQRRREARDRAAELLTVQSGNNNADAIPPRLAPLGADRAWQNKAANARQATEYQNLQERLTQLQSQRDRLQPEWQAAYDQYADYLSASSMPGGSLYDGAQERSAYENIDSQLKAIDSRISDLQGRIQNTEQSESFIADNYSRWIELASSNRVLTRPERDEAQAAVRALNSIVRDSNRIGASWDTEDRKQVMDYSALANVLESKSSGQMAFSSGLVSSVPFAEQAFNSLATKETDMFGGYISPDVLGAVQGNSFIGNARQAHPGLAALGNTAGSIGLMLGAGAAAKGATAGWQWLSSAPKWVQGAINSGMAFGLTGTLSAADRATAEHGLTWEAALDTLKGAGVSALSGALGGAASYGAGALGGAALQRLGLTNNKLAQAAVSGLSGATFAAGRTSVNEFAKYLEYPEGYTPDWNQISSDMIVSFAFATLSSLGRQKTDSTNSAVNKGTNQALADKYFKGVDNLEDLNSAFRKLAKAYHPDVAGDASTEIMKEINAARAYLTELFVSKSANAAAEAHRTATTTTGAERQSAVDVFNRETAALVEAVNTGAITGGDAIEAAQILQQVSASGIFGGIAGASMPPGAMPAFQQNTAQGAAGALPGLSLPGMAAAPIGNGMRYSFFGENDYSYEGKSLSGDSIIYNYDFLLAQPDMKITQLPDISGIVGATGRIERKNVVQAGIDNASAIGDIGKDGKVYITNSYTGRDLRIDTSTIRHSLDGRKNRVMTNARLGSVAGNIIVNAIPINALNNETSEVAGTYAMAALARDKEGREYVAVITVKQRSGDVDRVELYDVAYSISGRHKNSSQVDTKSQGVYPLKAATVSIPDFLDIVNSTHQSILSDDVLRHFGAERNLDGYYASKVKYSADMDLRGGTDNGQSFSAEIARQFAGGEPGEGDALPYGIVGRNAGARTGEQAGIMDRGAEDARAGAIEQRRIATERRTRTDDLRLEQVSSREAGLGQFGGDAKTLYVMPYYAWDAEMQQSADMVFDKTGRGVTYIIGDLYAQSKSGAVSTISAAYPSSGNIIIKADHDNLSTMQLAKHEVFHFVAARTPGLVWEIRNRIMQKFSESEFEQISEAYIQRLRGYIDVTPDMSADEQQKALMKIWEEIFADAYGEINAFGQNATQYTDTVNDELGDTYESYRLPSREVAAATARTTGPPLDERYSIANTRGMPNENKFNEMLPGVGKSYPRLLAQIELVDENIAYDGGGVNPKFSVVCLTCDNVRM